MRVMEMSGGAQTDLWAAVLAGALPAYSQVGLAGPGLALRGFAWPGMAWEERVERALGAIRVPGASGQNGGCSAGSANPLPALPPSTSLSHFTTQIAQALQLAPAARAGRPAVVPMRLYVRRGGRSA